MLDTDLFGAPKYQLPEVSHNISFSSTLNISILKMTHFQPHLMLDLGETWRSWIGIRSRLW